MGVALLSLFVALTGTSIAAVAAFPPNSVAREPKNGSVGTQELKGRSVTFGKIAAGAITSGVVRNGSLTMADFNQHQLPTGLSGLLALPAPSVPRTGRRARPSGCSGAPGPRGPKGDPGPCSARFGCRPRAWSYTTLRGRERRAPTSARCAPAASVRSAQAPAGLSAGAADVLYTVELRPILDRRGVIMGYQASGANGTGSPRTFTLYVSCYRR